MQFKTSYVSLIIPLSIILKLQVGVTVVLISWSNLRTMEICDNNCNTLRVTKAGCTRIQGNIVVLEVVVVQ